MTGEREKVGDSFEIRVREGAMESLRNENCLLRERERAVHPPLPAITSSASAAGWL